MPLRFPEAGEVLVRHTAIGVNFIDVYCRTGYFPLIEPKGVPGMEAAGAYGNFSGATSDINATEVISFNPRADPQQSSRTRGLSAPGFTRGFFTKG